MSDRPTPETDRHVRTIGADGLADGDFARELERERDEAIELLRKIVAPPCSSTAFTNARAFLARIGKDKTLKSS